MDKNFKLQQKILVSKPVSQRFTNNNQIEKYGLGSKALSALGYSEEDYPIVGAGLDILSYLNPYTGVVSAGIDTYDALKRGDYKDAGIEALFAIPLVGAVGKTVKSYKGLAKAAQRGNKAARATRKAADKTVQFIDKPYIKIPGYSTMGYVLGSAVNDIYNNAGAIYDQGKKEFSDIKRDLTKKVSKAFSGNPQARKQSIKGRGTVQKVSVPVNPLTSIYNSAKSFLSKLW